MMDYTFSQFAFFLFGMIAMGSFITGIYFMKYYARTRDRLLFYFGTAFFIMTAERILLSLSTSNQADEARSYIYILRLVSFLLIIYGIYEKNRLPRSKQLPRKA